MKSLEDYSSLRSNPRMRREAETVGVMIDIYCSEKHGTNKRELCEDCRELQEYSLLRLSKCPFQEGKTTCGNCRVHCYKPDMRERIRTVMRYAGPKMAYKHPVMAVYHVIDSRRKKPIL